MSAGTPDIYERDGRRFVESGIGTIGWGIYTLYKEVDFNGNVIDSFPKPLEWIFPDPAKVAAQKQREDERRQFLERCARDFPIEGMSGNFVDGGLGVWPTNRKDDELCVEFSVDKCDFCMSEKPTVSIATSDYGSLNVCRGCLGNMFYAFETKEAVKA